MNLPQLKNKPYKPNFVHLFFDWLDRLPLPAWVSVLILFPKNHGAKSILNNPLRCLLGRVPQYEGCKEMG